MVKKKRNPLRIDPSRTTLLRRSFVAEMDRRFARVRAQVWEMVAKQDAFGLREPKPLTFNAPEKRAWQFHTLDEKHKAFKRWFKQQVDQGILEVDRGTKPWLAKFVESAYKKGALRAYMDAHKTKLGKSLDFYKGTQEQFLQSAFGRPERLSKVRMLYERAYDELKGMTAAMDQQMSRVLADGLAHGKGPYDIARTMSNTITGITRQRAKVIARTEIIHAHAEGQLDSFEDMGVEELGVLAEWSTADDEDVCPMCEALEGTTLTVDEARGLLPRHPNCRCAWIPANVGEDEEGQTWTKRGKTGNVNDSIRAEKPGRSLADARAGSMWAGKTKKYVTTPLDK